MRRSALVAVAVPLLSAATPTATVEVDLTALRNSHGTIHACMTRNPAFFPNCKKDPEALKQSVPANVRRLEFTGVPAGRYALSVFHDENANQKLDTLVGIPKEGFGFSRNPVIRFGPPRFDKVSIELPSGFTRTSVRMQYLL
ncbi:DUF2141 domain-containing protein [Sphingomonas daechungensis]|uniref:DUF2141 domain-containing protein n=1 Tax=Sphingomonas daechungensis TaxID=1176646 RepID=UPI003785053A